MKNKYVILALTFLFLFVEQNSYSQDYYTPPQYDGDFVNQQNDPTSSGVNHLYEVAVSNNYQNDYSYILTILQQNYPSQPTSPDIGDGGGYSTYTPPPPVAQVAIPQNPCLTAVLANHAYNTAQGIQIAGKDGLNEDNVTLVNPSELPYPLSNLQWSNSSGFNSSLYKVSNGDGTFGYVYSTAGTDDLYDIVDDVQQGSGFDSAQYNLSVSNAIQIAQWASINGYSLSFTGHSLGGGLANANALATHLPATIYNPAGLSDNTITSLSLDTSYSNLVTAYVVKGDPVDVANYLTSSYVRGTTKYIGSSVDPVLMYGAGGVITVGSFGAVGVGTLLYAAYNLHSMNEVIANLNCN